MYQEITYLHSEILSEIRLIGEAHPRRLCAKGLTSSQVLSLHFSGHFLLLTELKLNVSRNHTVHFALVLFSS
jgi:hypothetical protein